MAASHRKATVRVGVGAVLATIFLGGCGTRASETTAPPTTVGPVGWPYPEVDPSCRAQRTRR